MCLLSRGCPIKKFTNLLLHMAKMIDPRVKSQARGQNNRSKALKWGIVHPCHWNDFWGMINNKICNFLEFSHFSQFSIVLSAFFYKNVKFVVSLIVIELQRCKLPHFKALDLLFWPLAWLLTLGSIIFVVWSKTFVNFFMGYPLPQLKPLAHIYY